MFQQAYGSQIVCFGLCRAVGPYLYTKKKKIPILYCCSLTWIVLYDCPQTVSDPVQMVPPKSFGHKIGHVVVEARNTTKTKLKEKTTENTSDTHSGSPRISSPSFSNIIPLYANRHNGYMYTLTHTHTSRIEYMLVCPLQSPVVTYQPHNRRFLGHSLPPDSNKANTPRATMGKRLSHKNTLHLKKHTYENQHAQVVNEANAQGSHDWLGWGSDVIH